MYNQTNSTFNNRHSLEEWAYLHVYNMIVDDFLGPDSPFVFDNETIRKCCKDSAAACTKKYNYLSFAVQGLDIVDQIEILNKAYDLAVEQYTTQSNTAYTFSRQR